MSNCNCISDTETRIKKHVIEKEIFKKPVKSASLKSVAVTFPHFIRRSVSEIEFELEGQKKKPTISIFHTYCPFCGVKVEKDDA